MQFSAARKQAAFHEPSWTATACGLAVTGVEAVTAIAASLRSSRHYNILDAIRLMSKTLASMTNRHCDQLTEELGKLTLPR